MTADARLLTIELLKQSLTPIAALLDDPHVTDIQIFGHQRVYVKRQGRRPEMTGIEWLSGEDLLHVAKTIGRFIKRRLDNDNPILDSRLPDGSRVNIVIPPCAPQAYISIRLFPKFFLNVDDLIRFGSLDAVGAKILESIIRLGRNTIISGGTGSGKTTLLNVLCSYIPHDDLVVTVEDSREIRIGNDLWAPLESKKALHQDDKEITLRDLVRNSLRMYPKWVIVGEVRGAEALDLVRAFNTGHCGMGTIHANSVYDALLAMENLILQSGLEMSARAVRDMVARAVRVVVQVDQLPDDSRKIVEIAEVLGLDYDRSSNYPPYMMNTLYRYNFQCYDDGGRAVGSFESANRPQFFSDLARIRNYEPPDCWLNGGCNA